MGQLGLLGAQRQVKLSWEVNQCEPLVGGMSLQKQERLLRRRPEVVVATPGRLWELMHQQVRPCTALPVCSYCTCTPRFRV